MNIYIDIETIPSQNPKVKADIAEKITPPKTMSKPETIAKWENEEKPNAIENEWRKTSFEGWQGKIICIGVAIGGLQPVAIFEDDEKYTPGEFFNYITSSLESYNTEPVLIGHNIAGFDLPFIYKRCIVLGIRPPQFFLRMLNAKPWDNCIFDTKKLGGSLNTITEAIGGNTKGDLDGSKVWDYYKDGRIDDIAKYCIEDVERTRQIFNRMNFID